MKALLTLIIVITLFASCKKKESDVAPSNWKLGTNTFSPVTIGRVGDQFFANDSVGLLAIRFQNSLPTSSGVYTVQSVEAQFGVMYVGGGFPATVSVSGGKLTVDIQNASLREMPLGQDTLVLHAHLVEQ